MSESNLSYPDNHRLSINSKAWEKLLHVKCAIMILKKKKKIPVKALFTKTIICSSLFSFLSFFFFSMSVSTASELFK